MVPDIQCCRIVRLQSGGTVEIKYWDSEKEENFWEDCTENFGECLFYHCELGEDVKLKDFFLLMEQDVDFFTMLFADHFALEYISTALDIIAKEDYADSELDSLVINGKHLELYDSFTDVFGMCQVSGRKKDDEEGRAIDFVPLAELLDLPVEIEYDFSLYDFRNSEESVDRIEGVNYRLIDVMNAIMHEISFHGLPESKKKRRDELAERIKQVKENLVGENSELEFPEGRELKEVSDVLENDKPESPGKKSLKECEAVDRQYKTLDIENFCDWAIYMTFLLVFWFTLVVLTLGTFFLMWR